MKLRTGSEGVAEADGDPDSFGEQPAHNRKIDRNSILIAGVTGCARPTLVNTSRENRTFWAEPCRVFMGSTLKKAPGRTHHSRRPAHSGNDQNRKRI
jgi:hypothetical protein